MELIDKFNNHVIKQASCWGWNHTVNKYGYGEFWLKGQQYKAHRVSYIIYKGQIPKGLCVLHTCDNPICTNPDHLWLGTHLDNIKDMNKKNRQAKGESQGCSKLREWQIPIIRKMTKSKLWTQKQIGDMFGVSDKSVSNIKLKRKWAWL